MSAFQTVSNYIDEFKKQNRKQASLNKANKISQKKEVLK